VLIWTGIRIRSLLVRALVRRYLHVRANDATRDKTLGQTLSLPAVRQGEYALRSFVGLRAGSFCCLNESLQGEKKGNTFLIDKPS
jgi:hypothetical protein